MLVWNTNSNNKLGQQTVVVERSPGWLLFSMALWGLAGYGTYKLITR